MKFFGLKLIPFVIGFGRRDKEGCDHFVIDIQFTLFGKRYDFLLERE